MKATIGQKFYLANADCKDSNWAGVYFTVKENGILVKARSVVEKCNNPEVLLTIQEAREFWVHLTKEMGFVRK